MTSATTFQYQITNDVLIVEYRGANPLESVFDEAGLNDLITCLGTHVGHDVIIDFGFGHWDQAITWTKLLQAKRDYVANGRMILCGVSDTAHVACRFLNLEQSFDICETVAMAKQLLGVTTRKSELTHTV